MTRKILSFVGISAMVALFTLNVCNAIDDYGILKCSLSKQVYAQSSSSSSDGGGGSTIGENGEPDDCEITGDTTSSNNPDDDSNKVWDYNPLPNTECYVGFADSGAVVKGKKTACFPGKKFEICPDCVL